jgi:hypothetical protein
MANANSITLTLALHNNTHLASTSNYRVPLPMSTAAVRSFTTSEVRCQLASPVSIPTPLKPPQPRLNPSSAVTLALVHYTTSSPAYQGAQPCMMPSCQHDGIVSSWRRMCLSHRETARSVSRSYLFTRCSPVLPRRTSHTHRVAVMGDFQDRSLGENRCTRGLGVGRLGRMVYYGKGTSLGVQVVMTVTKIVSWSA